MKILVTGATGYIGKRLIPILLDQGHQVICAARDIQRVKTIYNNYDNIYFFEADFSKSESLLLLPIEIDYAFYLLHSMSNTSDDFYLLEQKCALNFKNYLNKTQVKQVIYLSGITNDENLSKHLLSRLNVENELKSESYALTVLKAGIIVGSGSASFEIIRDLVEKLPIMVAPKWLNTKTQPIAVRDVLKYLTESIGKVDLYNQSIDIYGPEVMTYKEMLMAFAQVRGLKRWIFTVPVMTPKLSSYWLYFITSTSFKLASSLVESMGVEILGQPHPKKNLFNVVPLSYKEAVKLAFEKIEQNGIISSWKDSYISSGYLKNYKHDFINVPKFGCFKDIKKINITDKDHVIDNIWKIGGQNGWYYGTILWKIRGFIDKLYGGIGLRRGRRHPTELVSGDALDFWGVILADKKNYKLLLYAEMKLPGEAWLEFNIKDQVLTQIATFRPKGIAGRLYWWAVTPFHWFVFKGMINNIVKQ